MNKIQFSHRDLRARKSTGFWGGRPFALYHYLEGKLALALLDRFSTPPNTRAQQMVLS